MSMPEDLNPIAARVYEEILPVAYDDASTGYFLAHMVEAWTQALVPLEAIVRDTDDGPGWSAVLDPDRAPAMFLRWLSMVVGSPWKSGETEEQSRIRIKGMTGLRRGSAVAMRAAASAYLVSTDPDRDPYVIFNERQGGNAWRLAVRTLASETPDEDLVLAALMDQKPIGIILTYDAIDGITYDTVNAAFDTYAEVLSEYEDYAHVLVDLPA